MSGISSEEQGGLRDVDPQRRVGPTVRARVNSVRERAPRLIPVDAAAALARVPAVADVDVHSVPAGQTPLDQPVRGGRPSFDTPPPFSLASFLVLDPSPGTFQVAPLDSLQEAEEVESRQAWIVHAFDSMIQLEDRNPYRHERAPPMDVHELLAQHALDPTTLEPAPAEPTRVQVKARYDFLHTRACTACGKEEDSRTSRVAVFPEAGPRWVDLCREHTLATMAPWRGPSTTEGILADLREVAAQVGLPLRLWTDEEGWSDEPRP